MAAVPARLATALQDRYRLDRELGQGGMATVYLAHDLHNNRPVALKVLRPELAAILGAERFLKEIETTANLQHPHILPLFDSGAVQASHPAQSEGSLSFLYYVMPYVEGESLRDRLNREKQLPIPDAVRIATEVASALDYAHRRGVLHRDIKPENILLHDGQALVADFGIALAMRNAGGARLTETGLSLGTPQYMSPEQATAERELDARTDVYALGAITYEMLTGEPPFMGTTTQAIIAKLMTEAPRPPSVLRKAVPPQVEAAVLTALEKLPADRFASAAEFAAALVEMTARRPVGARAPAPASPTAPRALGSVATATTIIVLVALAAWGWARKPLSAGVNRQRIVLGLKAHGTARYGTGMAVSPDGESIVFCDTAGGVTQLWSKERNQVDAIPVPGTAGAIGVPFFSPDGQWLAFLTRDGWLSKMPRRGGSAVRLAQGAGGLAGAWLSDGTILFNTANNGLALVADTGGPVRILIKEDRGIIALSPFLDGRGALFTSCTAYCYAGMDIWLIDLPSGRVRKLLDQTARAWFLADGRLLYVRRDGGVYVAPADLRRATVGAAGEPLAEGVRTDFVGLAYLDLSASGTLLYAAGANAKFGPVRALWVGRDGQASLIDSAWTPILEGGWPLALAPDGHKLAVVVQNDTLAYSVWVKALDHGPASRLTGDYGGFLTSPAWSPDGRSVTFASADSGGTLWAIPSDGSQPARALLHHAGIAGATFTPDGRSLMGWSADSVEARKLWVFRPGTDTAPRTLLSVSANLWNPVISPDGRWIAYVSDESGRPEVYVRPFPDAGSGKWQISKEGGWQPLWAHTGRELFYRTTRDVVAVTVAAGSPFSVLREQTLFRDRFNKGRRGGSYDIAPDDRRFLMVEFVENWREAPVDLVMVEHITEAGAGRPRPDTR